MQLKINKEPSITAYAHHSFPLAIIERDLREPLLDLEVARDRKSTRLNSSHRQ